MRHFLQLPSAIPGLSCRMPLPTVADAICDRVLHGAHKVTLEGPSRRKVKGNPTAD